MLTELEKCAGLFSDLAAGPEKRWLVFVGHASSEEHDGATLFEGIGVDAVT